MNLEKIKKILKSKKGIVASGVIVGTIVIGIIGGVLVNGASKSNDIAENNKPVINNKKEDNLGNLFFECVTKYIYIKDNHLIHFSK